jgi:hypothetical protein
MSEIHLKLEEISDSFSCIVKQFRLDNNDKIISDIDSLRVIPELMESLKEVIHMAETYPTSINSIEDFSSNSESEDSVEIIMNSKSEDSVEIITNSEFITYEQNQQVNTSYPIYEHIVNEMVEMFPPLEIKHNTVFQTITEFSEFYDCENIRGIKFLHWRSTCTLFKWYKNKSIHTIWYPAENGCIYYAVNGIMKIMDSSPYNPKMWQHGVWDKIEKKWFRCINE